MGHPQWRSLGWMSSQWESLMALSVGPTAFPSAISPGAGTMWPRRGRSWPCSSTTWFQHRPWPVQWSTPQQGGQLLSKRRCKWQVGFTQMSQTMDDFPLQGFLKPHLVPNVSEGPSNIQINGPPMLTFGTTSVFTCSADCYPSCSYSWTIVLEDQTFGTAQGDTISVTPPASTVSSETLLCQAEDTVSHLYISTALNLWVASRFDLRTCGRMWVHKVS